MLWQEYTFRKTIAKQMDLLAVPNGFVYFIKDAGELTNVASLHLLIYQDAVSQDHSRAFPTLPHTLVAPPEPSGGTYTAKMMTR